MRHDDDDDDINDYISMLPSQSLPHTRTTTPELDKQLSMAANQTMLINSSGAGSNYNKRPKHIADDSSAKKRSNN